MAEEIVTAARLAAGEDYLNALRALGFFPDALLWTIPGNREDGEDLQLCLVSSLIDSAGPKKIYELLFKAYDRAGTPKSIDPWIVSLYGRGTVFAQTLENQFELAEKPITLVFSDGTEEIGDLPWQLTADRMFQPHWVYVRTFRKSDTERELRTYRRFSENVEALAA